MKYMKTKYWLLLLFVIVLVVSVWMSIYNHTVLKFTLSSHYFSDSGSEVLMHKMEWLTLYDPPVVCMIMLTLRNIVTFALPIMSGALLYKQRTLRNGIYFLISSYIFFIGTIDMTSNMGGIYNLFKKIYASYYLGVTVKPWLLYYLSVLVIIVLMIGLVSHEIYRNKKIGCHNEENNIL